jgi:hypothetical protein
VTTTTRVKQPTTTDGSMLFPVISFCNAKPYMTRAAYDYAIEQFIELYGNETELSDIRKSALYHTSYEPGILKNFYDDQFINEIVFTIIQRIADLNQTSGQQLFGLTFSEFFNYYNFNSRLISSDYFTWYWDPLHGVCFRFNTGRMQNGSKINLMYQSESGQNSELSTIHIVDVFQNQSYNFLNSFQTSTLGVRVGIDDQDAIPLSTNMIPVRPGACTYLALKKTVTTRLPQPYSSCKTNFRSVLYDKFAALNKTYSQRACFEMCKQMQVIETFNCSIVYYLNVDSYPTCKTIDIIDTFYYSFTFNMDRCGNLCPVECVSTSFDFTTATELFPNDDYFNILQDDPTMKKLFDNANVSLENASFLSVANSVACIYIYYQDLQTTFISESQSMDVVSYLIFYRIVIYLNNQLKLSYIMGIVILMI